MTPKKGSLSTLSNEALCKLRDEIATLLNDRAKELRKELEQLTGSLPVNEREANGRENALKAKGDKIAPKYQGPGGNTWCGRGARPRWLASELKRGKKLEDFLIVPQ